MKKLIIHIGYPKTATTSLQLNVFTALMKRGEIEYLNHLEQGNPAHGTFSTKNIISHILGQDLNVDWQEEAKEFTQITKEITVLSNEPLSYSSEKFSTVSSRAGAVRNAQKVYRIFTPYFDTIEILMTVREQSSMALSLYTQEYYNLSNYNPNWTDFRAWFSDTFKQNTSIHGQFLDYHAMYMAYATCFGKEKIHVLVYEDLIYDKNSFYQKLAQVFKIKDSLIKSLFESSVHNSTKKINKDIVKTDKGNLSALLFSIAHKIFRNKDSKFFSIIKKIIKPFIPKKLLNAKIGSGVEIRQLTDNEQIFIKNMFNRSNEQLITIAKLCREKMAQYGYIEH